jgi:hypothetical protein
MQSAFLILKTAAEGRLCTLSRKGRAEECIAFDFDFQTASASLRAKRQWMLATTTIVVARLDRAIQYAAASRLDHKRLWNTGSPAFAGDDNRVWRSSNAPRNDGVRYDSAFSRRAAPEFCTVLPSTMRAQGMPDARCTRSLACESVESTRGSHHRFTGTSRHSLHNGLRLIRDLPGEPRSVATVAKRFVFANLTPA